MVTVAYPAALIVGVVMSNCVEYMSDDFRTTLAAGLLSVPKMKLTITSALEVTEGKLAIRTDTTSPPTVALCKNIKVS